MNRHANGFVESRGTALVVSSSSLFKNIVGDLLSDCGLTAAFPAEAESAGLSVTRTQPAVVICDSGLPEAIFKRLIVELSARRLPLLMAWSQEQHHEYGRGVVLPERVAWLTFPIDHAAFRSTMDGLLPPKTGPTHRLTLTSAKVTVEAAIGAHSLDEAPQGAAVAPNGQGASVTDHTLRKPIRLLP